MMCARSPATAPTGFCSVLCLRLGAYISRAVCSFSHEGSYSDMMQAATDFSWGNAAWALPCYESPLTLSNKQKKIFQHAGLGFREVVLALQAKCRVLAFGWVSRIFLN